MRSDVDHRAKRRIGATLCLAAMLVVLGATPAAGRATSAADPAAVAAAAAARARIGLPSDAATIEAILGSTRDVGTEQFGIPLTQAEAEKVDLQGRSRRADRADKEIRPVARKERGYAGMYQDQLHGGRIVVRFTKLSQHNRAAVELAAAPDSVVVDTTATYTFAELAAAADGALAQRSELFPGIRVYAAGVNEQNNVLDVGVDQTDLLAASQFVPTAESALGVGINLVVATPTVDQAQTCAANRTYCFDPMRAGTLVHNASWDGATCTMGFHTQNRSNTSQKYFIMSGHCSYPNGSNNWYMNSYTGPAGNGFIGTAASGRNLYKDLGQDAMFVAMPSNQVSRQIYDTSRAVAGSGNPVGGETVWISRGYYDYKNGGGFTSGTVAHATWSYLDTDNDYIIHGADADGWTTIDGDSGSPIFRAPGSGGAIAVGIHDTVQGYFARMQDALNAENMSVY
jgi:hypothetical protein